MSAKTSKKRKISRPSDKRKKWPIKLRASEQKKIDSHIGRVQRANVSATTATWKLADELLALVRTYSKCYGRLPSAWQLSTLTKIDLDPCRQLLYVRLAAHFPHDFRKDGIGMRVYEAAYKYNQSLKYEDRKPFTAERIAAMIADGNDTSSKIQMTMASEAATRDFDATIARRKANREAALQDPTSVTKSKKLWLKMIQEDPDRAIAAAIAINDNEDTVYRINLALQQLDCKLRVRSTVVYEQIEITDYVTEGSTEGASA